jgi:RNA polymerase sigma factor (TIGR02999 family)
MGSSETDLTGLLRAWSAGDPGAADELIPIVYEELRRQASRYLGRERTEHTLQPTALVNEAYMRLAEQRRVQWHDRGQFFAVAATVMRRLLVDYARRHGASKRGACCTISLGDEEVVALTPAPDVDVLALNDALTELAEIDPLRMRLVELRFFGGLTTDETAEALGVSSATVTRGWRLARAWLHTRLTDGAAADGQAGDREERRQGVPGDSEVES